MMEDQFNIGDIVVIIDWSEVWDGTFLEITGPTLLTGPSFGDYPCKILPPLGRNLKNCNYKVGDTSAWPSQFIKLQTPAAERKTYISPFTGKVT